MVAAWVVEEMQDVNLGDKRLNARMTRVLDQLAGHASASIPAACNGWAETLGAYRLFDNERVTFEKLLEPHIERSYRRIQEQPVVVLAQDTTDIDLTRPRRKVVGAGPLNDGSRRGAMLHPLVGFTPNGTPLGTVYAEAWTRDEAPAESMTTAEKKYARKHTAIEDKESVRWVDTLRRAQDVAEHAPQTHCICVADSEADLYELFVLGRRSTVDWIVRGCQNRTLRTPRRQQPGRQQPAGTESDLETRLRERVLATDCLFTNEISVRARQSKVACTSRRRERSRPARDATVAVRAETVELRAPWRHDRQLPDVCVNVVLVTEVNAPQGEEPIEWMLLTSLPVDRAEQVRVVIQYYAVRWMIEVYFRTLKSSCRIEERQFETMDRALNAVAIYMIVAWRALMVSRISREMPDSSCEILFEPEEWKSVYYVVHQQPPPTKPPTLKMMTRMLGELGGYVNRGRTDEPGPQTIALGLQRAHDITNCWLIFGPESKRTKCV